VISFDRTWGLAGGIECAIGSFRGSFFSACEQNRSTLLVAVGYRLPTSGLRRDASCVGIRASPADT
jgi:hypothetical protein